MRVFRKLRISALAGALFLGVFAAAPAWAPQAAAQESAAPAQPFNPARNSAEGDTSAPEPTPARQPTQPTLPPALLPSPPSDAASAESDQAPPRVLAGPGDTEYVLGANDRLRVSVFGEPSLSGEFVVDGTGRAALPLVGEIAAAGMTVRQFERAFEGALERGEFLNEARVTAEVLNFRPFFILGEVARPNQYPYASGLSVLNAIATAGGFTPLADQTRVFIRRAGADAEIVMPLTPEAIVYPGDTIRVPKGAFYILGEVNRPGEYAYSSGLTVLNAVATAAGFTYRANRSRVWIQRAGEAEEEAHRLRPDLRVEPGDTIRIGERFF